MAKKSKLLRPKMGNYYRDALGKAYCCILSDNEFAKCVLLRDERRVQIFLMDGTNAYQTSPDLVERITAREAREEIERLIRSKS